MKEIALLGTVCPVQADILGTLLAQGLSVNAMVDNPEHVMVEDSRLTVTRVPVENHDRVFEALEGYHDVVLAYNDDLSDSRANSLTLKYFYDTALAAQQAGVSRLIVVGSPDATAFFVSDLRRLNGIDWVYISTEGAFARHTAEEIISPRFHCEEYERE